MTAVYFNDLDQICHNFGQFTAPKANRISKEKFELYKDVVEGFYRFYDMMLDRLLVLAGDHTNIIILSDHGFKLGEQKIKSLPKMPAAIALEHNPFGIICTRGPKFKEKGEILEASLLDIAPTVLDLFDLPISKDMDGKVLTTALKKTKKRQEINSWELQKGDFGDHKDDKKIDTFGAHQALDQLIELGYIDELDDDKQEQIQQIIRDTKYNLSQVHGSQGENRKAIKILEELYQEDKVDLRFNKDLIQTYTKLGDYEKALEILSNFRKFDISGSLDFDQLEGEIRLVERNFVEAEKLLMNCYDKNPTKSSLLAQIGILQRRKKNYAKAEIFLKRAIATITNDSNLYHHLGIVLRKQEKFEEAIEAIVKSLELAPRFPAAHYQLGECLRNLKDFKNAVDAYETCLLLNPGLNRARNRLLDIYKNELKDQKKFSEHESVFANLRAGQIIVVTGLPRSGTSMMMQMLQRGGIPVFADDSRRADENNPNGYFESKLVKGSKKDSSWLRDATGKAVKVVTPLITSLQIKYSYKVIWMDRKISEVIVSQEEMLAKLNPERKAPLNLMLQDQFKKMLANAEEYLNDQHNVELLRLNYEDVVSNPEEYAKKVYEFLGERGDAKKMAGAVKPELHRVKMDIADFST